MVFLMAVLFSAVSFGIWPAVYASVLSFLAYNFFFITPLYTFQIAQPHELLALVIFLIVAIVTAALAGRVRGQAVAANERARTMGRLYEFTWRLSGFTDIHAIADGATGEIHTSLRRPAVLLLGHGRDLSLAAAWPPDQGLSAADIEAAQGASVHDEASGFDTKTRPDIAWHFVPLRTQSGSVGLVGVSRNQGEAALDGEARALLSTLAEQTAAALERAFLAREMTAARNTAETERVRNLLLTSISHDFRTPLAAILGSATSLIGFRDKLGDADQAALLRAIKVEAEGLDEMVRNLLAMTRIDAGALELRRDWVDLREIAERVVSAGKRRGAELRFVLDLPSELPMIAADALLIEQALGNVINNVVAHTPPGTRVTVGAAVTPEAISLRVTDDGPGISSDALPRIFEKFVRADGGAAARGDRGEGTGLGLAIAKGISVAHGGTVFAESPVADGRGTRITLTFPREPPR